MGPNPHPSIDGLLGRRLARRQLLALAAAGGAGAVLAACSSGGSGSASTHATTTFPLGAAARASSKPVPITMWHSMTYNNQTTLQNLTDQFNSSQSDVKVTLVNQASYTDTLTLFTAALSGGGLPDVAQMETVDLQLLIDSRSVVPVSSAIAADHYDTSDFLSSTLSFFTVGGHQWAMPFNISSNVLYYDKNAFEKAGLDPDTPPATIDDMRSYAQKVVGAGVERYGASLKLQSAYFEQWMALDDALLLNHGNGRSGRATAVAFDDAAGLKIFEFIGGMLQDKLAQGTSPTTYDNLLGIANRIAPMALETSAALGTVESILSGGQYSDVSLGVGPTPATAAGAHGGVFIGGAGLYIVGQSTPERQDAAWQFIKHLVSPSSLATWAVGTGYIPIRKSAVTTPIIGSENTATLDPRRVTTVSQLWDQDPHFKVAYDQVEASPTTPATAGAVAGPFSTMENDIDSALSSLSTGTSPRQALATAASACNRDLSSYNARVGA